MLTFRHTHQVTVLALQKLKREAFSQHGDEEQISAWEDQRRRRSPTFLFWNIIIEYETLVLSAIRAYRQRNLSLYIEAMEELIPLFFALDHVNYAQWAPIHIRDMKSLPDSIAREFQREGHWVLSKTGNKFSAIPFDQAHEQENKVQVVQLASQRTLWHSGKLLKLNFCLYFHKATLMLKMDYSELPYVSNYEMNNKHCINRTVSDGNRAKEFGQ